MKAIFFQCSIILTIFFFFNDFFKTSIHRVKYVWLSEKSDDMSGFTISCKILKMQKSAKKVFKKL